MASTNVSHRNSSNKKTLAAKPQPGPIRVRCGDGPYRPGNTDGAVPVVLGNESSITSAKEDVVIAIGARARAHTSAHLARALVIGMRAMAEVDGHDYCTAIAVGTGAKAVSYEDECFAYVIGHGGEAAALGHGGVAVVIEEWDGSSDLNQARGIVSAGAEGKLIIVRTWNEPNTQIVFEQVVDGREFRAGRRYRVDSFGLWEEVVPGEEYVKPEEYPPSQVKKGKTAVV